MAIEITTLGSLEIRVDGREVPDFAHQPVRTALLVYLATEAETTRDSTVAVLWPDRDTPRARHALSQTLYELKRTLGGEWLESQGERLRLRADAVELDARRLERAAADGDHGRVVELYRGPFLDGWHLAASAEFQQWVDRRRERLARLYRAACRRHTEEQAAVGDRVRALETARDWVAREPLEPEPNHLLLSLLLDAGDAAGALRAYRSYERHLAEEDLEPLPETRTLRERIELRLSAGSDRTADARLAGPGTEVRIAVLPFEHHGGEEDHYFTEGFVDELTSELARIPGLAVTARTSSGRYADPVQPLAEIAEELNVEYIIRGSVRFEPSRMPIHIRIAPALVRARDETRLWGRTYRVEPSAAFEVEAEVAEEVVRTLGLEVPSSSAPRVRPGRDQEALELYVKGLQHANQRSAAGLRMAADLFQQALTVEPDFARAYAGLAQVYGVFPGFTGAQPHEWYPKARHAAERALELDPDLPEAHAALAFPLFHTWGMREAERHLVRCIELAPSYAAAWVRLGYVWCALGRPAEARDAAERGLALDPLSVATNFDTGYQFWQLRDRDRALRQFRLVQQLDPDFDPAHFFLGAHAFLEGDLTAARREWSRLQQLGPLWQRMVARIGRPEAAVAAVDQMTELAPGPVQYLGVSAMYTLFGAHDRALKWLEGHAGNTDGRSDRLPTGGPSLTHVVCDPLFDPLHGEPRFRALLRRMGLEAQTAASSSAGSSSV